MGTVAESVLAGVGLGYRRELAASLLMAPSAVDFVEIIAESCFASEPMRREAQGLAEIWPVLPHGIKLSLGSADGIDEDHARRLGALCRQLRAPLISEHVAFTRGRRREIGHLTQLPLSRTAVSVVARNLGRVRRHLPDVPFLLENPAWTLRWSRRGIGCIGTRDPERTKSGVPCAPWRTAWPSRTRAMSLTNTGDPPRSATTMSPSSAALLISPNPRMRSCSPDDSSNPPPTLELLRPIAS